MASSKRFGLDLLVLVCLLVLPQVGRAAGFSSPFLAPNGSTLFTYDYMQNGEYSLVMQGDCNLVLYRHWQQPGQIAPWASNTAGRGTDCRAAFQGDGNLVIYKNSGTFAVWASNTANIGGYYFVMNPDGSLVIANSSGKPLWTPNNPPVPYPFVKSYSCGPSICSPDLLREGEAMGAGRAMVSPSGRFALIMQYDCNLVLYDTSNWSAVWASNTRWKWSGCALTITKSYGSSYGAVLVTGTNFGTIKTLSAGYTFPGWPFGELGHLLRLQDDRNFVAYDIHGSNYWEPYWSTGTNF
ncbi:MAG TPA: hypothetical protein VGG91_06450 [Myxococcaceae bacterium]|jgi:hypothetical protein